MPKLVAVAVGVLALATGPALAETVVIETHVDASPDRAWALVSDVYHADRLTPGVLQSVERDGDDRLLHFASGVTIRQHIVTIDAQRRRVVYAAAGTTLIHHSASMQVVPDGTGARVVWTTDFLPAAARPAVTQSMEQGARSLRQALAAP